MLSVTTKTRAPIAQPTTPLNSTAGFMQAIVKEKPKDNQPWRQGLRLIEKLVPQILHPDDVKVEVIAAAICGTDVGIYNSKDSLKNTMSTLATDSVVIGHEFCGIIVDAGTNARLHLIRQLLDRHWEEGSDDDILRLIKGRSSEAIVSDPNLIEVLNEHFVISAEMHETCGWCYQCRTGQKHVCRNTRIKGIHTDGAFAKYMVINVNNLVLFRKNELPVEIIAFMDAFGNAVHTAQSVRLAGQTVAILGCGVQGLMATAIARFCGATRIFVTDASNPQKGLTPRKIEQNRFALAKKLGANLCFDVGSTTGHSEFIKAVLAETDGTGVDVVFEMSGSYKAYADAFDIVRMGGAISLLGIPEGEMNLDFAKKVIFPGVSIYGIIGRRVFETWEIMKAMLKSGLADKLLDNGFVTHQFPLEQFEAGFAAIRAGEALKVILRP